ncbi:hypothetical protein EOI86_10995 [Hwanghaeella grinnelliae]|uniref:DUF2282 domain-containing protein n=1 Tax=Hwanghaeella grinnelliae TaxID=2500179 RepID=A0A437QMM9_9PROT|nr:hypothetical protein [Hwanghaeella grinnelliae]RVU35788.1 hypothetical protein EOI86_10995 [Hwanghaeella grinnelliae]
MPIGLAVCTVAMLSISVSYAASDSRHDARMPETCMKAGSESEAECRKPMPPCPLRTQGVPDGPLLMLPNGVCGMLVDGGVEKRN